MEKAIAVLGEGSKGKRLAKKKWYTNITVPHTNTCSQSSFIPHGSTGSNTVCVNKSASLKEHLFLGKLYVSFEKSLQ